MNDRTFFFFSYEGLRLVQPVATTIMVPSVTAREQAIPAMRPYLNAFPIPNGPELPGGFASFSAAYSNPSNLDATSLRMDHVSAANCASSSDSITRRRSRRPGRLSAEV